MHPAQNSGRLRAFRPSVRQWILSLGCALLLPATALGTGTLTITVIDVGQGDATLIESPSGQTLLFDGGENGMGYDAVLPFLAARGVTTLSYMACSHYHSDHVGGLDEVLGSVPVTGAVYDRGWSYTTITYNSYVAAAGALRTTLTPGQVIDLGEGVTVTCAALNGNGQLSSPFSNGTYENEYDVCLKVEYGGFDLVVAGDLTGGGLGYRDIETSVAPLVGDVDVCRVSHHGSESSSNAAFLQTLQAEVAVISVGSNSYGHPHQSVLDRLAGAGSFVYQTEAGSGGTLPASQLTVVGGHVVIATDGIAEFSVDGDVRDLDEAPPSGVAAVLPGALRLLGNAPNPFNPSTRILFSTATAGPAALQIFDLAGRSVWSREFLAASGENDVDWRGVDLAGRLVPGGLYLYRVTTADGSDGGRMLLLK